jgi:hypothetical protein
MPDRAVVDPERNLSAALHPGLEVVDDERGLFLTVDVETCAVATHLNPDRRPHVRQKVDIRFVPGWRFLAQAEPRPVRERGVLRGVIPSLLVLGAAVRQPQGEQLIRPVVQPEGNTDEAARAGASPWCRGAGNLRRDHAIRELEALDHGVLPDAGLHVAQFVVGHALEPSERLVGQGDPQPLLALKHGWLGSHVVQAKAVGSLQRIVLDLSRRAPGKQERQRGRDNKQCGSSHLRLL